MASTFIADMQQDHLMCRLMRHPWKFKGAYRQKDSQGSYVVLDFECLSCGARRHDHLDRRSGEFITRQYEYPDGYLKKGAMSNGGRPHVQDVRVELLRRITVKDRR